MTSRAELAHPSHPDCAQRTARNSFSRLLLEQQQRAAASSDQQRAAAPGARLAAVSRLDPRSARRALDYKTNKESQSLKVLATASHYWPLDAVDGIVGRVWDEIGNRTALRVHNHTVLPFYNSSSIYTNDSAYTNISATVDIVEGVVNKGIYLNGDHGATFLHFGNYNNSCISDPTLCGPKGITFSFFWMNQEAESRFAVSSGGKVISNGFSVYTNSYGGYVEFYTRGNSRRWITKIKIPGPYWTHILFTWTLKSGLSVYVNGTFNVSDPVGNVSKNYGDPYQDLVIGTGNEESYKRYVTSGAFDEFVIWERALSPQEIWDYYRAAKGEPVDVSTTTSVPTSPAPTFSTPALTDAPLPVVTPVPEETQSDEYPALRPGVLESVAISLPRKNIPPDTANNLTLAFLKSVEEVLSSPGWPDVEEQSGPMVSGLIETVDEVMIHMVSNLGSSAQEVISIGGSLLSQVNYSLMKIPQNYNLALYRFPTQGKNYISVPGEAFTQQSQTTIVGLFYHTMHNYYREISP
ncbi:hypothetical protein AAFF_G00390570 [Aldrovandia affinis]|uniref:Uncharacterized protein n=1 Tax=Aldrovandia affinis TaxID=143900 RepID=A0AAD7WLH2_9TELE|nr:hypothetical protein AAFF_G00390570 [Aldrovandia affinis]